MLTYRRALLVAACILTFFWFIRSPSTPQSSRIYRPNEKYSDVGRKSKKTKSASSYIDTTTFEHQVAVSEVADKPIRKQLEYFFPYEPEDRFPAYVWQTWRYTPAMGQFTEEKRISEASWTDQHPGFIHEVITDEAALHLFRHLYSAIPAILEAYTALPLPILKADFFRYLILLARGGIYADIDTIALKSALDWVPAEVPHSEYGLVIGIEADADREDWAEWYSRRVQFCQWTIEAKAGHPVLREIVARLTEEILKRKRAGALSPIDSHAVIEFTGPAVWTDTIMDYFNDPNYFDMDESSENITWQHFTGITEAKKVGDVVVLPITCFSPGIQTMNAGDDDDPMAFVKHNFEGNWKPESERHIGEQDQQQ